MSSFSDDDNDEGGIPFFDFKGHVRFLEMMYETLPPDYELQEINHLTLGYFVISGLDILGALDRWIVNRTYKWRSSEQNYYVESGSSSRMYEVELDTFTRKSTLRAINVVNKNQISDWVLSFQAHPVNNTSAEDGQFYGFHGSKTSQFPTNDTKVLSYNRSHLASTYSALAILKLVGYNMSNLDSDTIVSSMRSLQQKDGSFMPIHIGAEKDLRFVYCAASISSLLNNWGGMDKEKARDFISKCQSYDGGFGLVPGSESHGGATFCAVAALQLMGFIEVNPLSKSTESYAIDVQLLLEWALQRQAVDGGFQGRANKDSDTCYAFWIYGVLKIIGALDFCDKAALRNFLFTCQSQYGGFKKFPEIRFPDLYHSYYGISAFSLLGEPELKPMWVELGIPLPGES